MKTFDINKIEVGDPEKNIPELLTGEVITPLSPDAALKPNSELEGGEYLKFPDGTVQRIKSEEHKEGGGGYNLPNGTAVVSNYLTLTKPQVKKLKEEYNLHLTTDDTYAEAVEKYTQKIGLTKLNSEQEEVFKELENISSKQMDATTLETNKAFLARKIKDIEDSKTPIEEERSKFFDEIFKLQEGSKKPNDKNDSDHLQTFLTDFAKKNNISEDQVKSMLQGLGYFADGGTKEGDPPFSGTFKVGFQDHTYSNKEVYEREKQHKSNAAFGKITEDNIDDVLQKLYTYFPDIILDSDVFGKNVKIENGKVVFDKNLSFNKQLPQVLQFQKKADARMNASADVIMSNPDLFGAEAVTAAEDFKKTQTFDESTARALDQKLGQFTSGRYVPGIDVVSPEEQAKLDELGVYTINQLKGNKDALALLSEGSKARLDKIAELQQKNPDSDFRIFNYENNAPETPLEKNPEEKLVVKTAEGTPLVDKTVLPKGANYPRLFFQPDQSVLPPSPLEAHLKNETRLGRIDPIRIGVEQTLQELSDNRQFVADQVSTLPDSQKTAALTNLLAISNAEANKAITNANVINANNQSQAELFNLQMAAEEANANANNALSFEQRQMMAKSNLEEELKRYYDYNRRVNVSNLRDQQRVNLIDNMFPQYNLDFFGSSVNFDPTTASANLDDGESKWQYINSLYGGK